MPPFPAPPSQLSSWDGTDKAAVLVGNRIPTQMKPEEQTCPVLHTN